MIKIEKHEKDFQAVKWVLRARSVNNTFKPFYTCLFSDGENVVCTDGQRLHMIKPVREVPAGLYDVISTTKEIVLVESKVDNSFPDYKQVLYGGKEKPEPLSGWNTLHGGAETLFDIMSKDVCLNPKHIEDVCKDCGKLTVISFESKITRLLSIRITNDFGTAIVATIPTKKE